MLLGDFLVEFPGDPADAGMACVDLRGRRVADLCTASSFVAINARPQVRARSLSSTCPRQQCVARGRTLSPPASA
jgi:hypothetical protein